MAYYKSDVPMVLGGKNVLYRLDYKAMLALSAKYGKRATKKLHAATQGQAIDVLIFGLAVGLERHQPGEYTFESIVQMDDQPAIVLVEEVVFESFMAFHYGATGPVAINPLVRLWNGLIKTWIRFFRRKN